MKKFKIKNKFSLKNSLKCIPLFGKGIDMLNKEQKAQSGAVFRLMIDAIIGIIVLAIILATLNYFNYLKIYYSFDEVNRKVLAATNSPNGDVIESNGNLFFLKGTSFTGQGFEELTGYSSECFSFKSGLSIVKVDDKSIQIMENIESKIYVRCVSRSISLDMSVCEIDCDISIGTKLEPIK